jgi:hypothetical protein
VKVKLDAVVAEIVRSFDSEVCDETPKFKSLLKAHRMHLLLQMLERRDVARVEKGSAEISPYWRPSKRLEGFFGVERHGFADEYEDVDHLPAILEIADQFARVILGKMTEPKVEKDVGIIISFFAMYRQGLVKYAGKGNDGLFLWRPTRKLKREIQEIEGKGAPTSILEEVDHDGNSKFSVRRVP